MLAQLQGFDTVVVPIGGGGLIGGTSMYLKARHPSVRVITVEDDEMLHAIRVLFEWEHLLAEPAGAAGLAALLFHRSEVAAGRRVVVIVSGANVSEEVLVRALKSRRPG